MNVELTDEQADLIEKAVSWYHRDREQVFQYSGPAGTGKSTVMHIIIERLGLTPDQVAPMAYTGSAAMVMRYNGFYNARTAHAWLYKPETYYEEDSHGHKHKRIRFRYMGLPKGTIRLICIDEGSMIPHNLRKDIERNGIKILVCGDMCQLPPIGETPSYLSFGPVYQLTKIMRQNKRSSIVVIADMLRNGLVPNLGYYGEVDVIPMSMLTDDMLIKSDIVICGTNPTRDNITNHIRRDILHINSNLPLVGEKIVCRKNNWHIEEGGINLANGLLGKVASKPTVTKMSDGKFDIDFIPDLFPNITFRDISCNYQYFVSDSGRKNRLRVPGAARLDLGNLFDFGYVITTHMSQGSQYRNGIFIEEDKFHEDQNKLNYTGITRFMNHCTYVLPRNKVRPNAFPIKKYVVMLDGKLGI